MIPYRITITSHCVVTAAKGFSLFLGITIVGFQLQGLHFFNIDEMFLRAWASLQANRIHIIQIMSIPQNSLLQSFTSCALHLDHERPV